jgi:hypothetical protein
MKRSGIKRCARRRISTRTPICAAIPMSHGPCSRESSGPATCTTSCTAGEGRPQTRRGAPNDRGRRHRVHRGTYPHGSRPARAFRPAPRPHGIHLPLVAAHRQHLCRDAEGGLHDDQAPSSGAELGPERRGDLPEDVHARETSPLLSPGQDPEGFVTALLDPATFRFAFVRNPYSRALSCWLDKMVANEFERARMAPMLGLDPDRPPSLADFLAASVRPAGGGARPPLGQPDPPAQPQRHQIRVYRPVRAFPRGVHPRLQASGDRGEGTGPAPNVACHGRQPKGPDPYRETEAAMIRTIYEADFRNFGYGWGTGLT